jgi:hypothetical protein
MQRLVQLVANGTGHLQDTLQLLTSGYLGHELENAFPPSDSGAQFPAVVRFRNVVVSAGLKPLNNVFLFAFGCQE